MKDNLVRRRVLHQDDAACLSGCQNLETTTHLFLACDNSVLFGLMFGTGWVFLWFLLVTCVNILFNSLIWRGCLDQLICSSESSGLPLFGFFGRKGMTVYLKTRLLILQSSLKR